MKNLKAIINGQVQGVCYRMEARAKAKEIGINGWVANMPDGSVVLEVEGEDEQLEDFLKWCWHGPSGAKVDDIKKEFTSDVKGFKDFEIRFI